MQDVLRRESTDSIRNRKTVETTMKRKRKRKRNNSLALHEVDIWDETKASYVPYTSVVEDSPLLLPSENNIHALQTTHGRWQHVNLGVVQSIESLFARGVFMSNPKKFTTRCFTFPFLDICQTFTDVAAVSQNNLQRVYTGSNLPEDHDVFNEAFMFYRVLRRELMSKLYKSLEVTQPPDGT